MASSLAEEIVFTKTNQLQKHQILSRKIDGKKYTATHKGGGNYMGFDEADKTHRRHTNAVSKNQACDLAFYASVERLVHRKVGACEAVWTSSPRTSVSLGEFSDSSASPGAAARMPVAAAPVEGKPTITHSDALLIKSNLLCQDTPVKFTSRKTLQDKQAPAALARRRLTEPPLMKSPEQPGLVQKNPTMMAELCEQFEGMKIRCKAADMVVVMQEHALHCAHKAMISSQKLQFKMIASLLKKEFDQTYGPAWHCIAGSNFGSYITHSVGGFFYFSIGKVSILLFKTSVEAIDHN